MSLSWDADGHCMLNLVIRLPLIVEPLAFAFEPRERAERDAADVDLQPQPQLQLAGDAVGVVQAVFDLDEQRVQAALLAAR